VINANLGHSGGYLHINLPLRHSARLKFDEFTYGLNFEIDSAAVSNAFYGYKNRFRTQYVSRLSQGAVISDCPFLTFLADVMLFKAPYSNGQFIAEGRGFIGFRFNNGSGMQYGWVRVKMPGPKYFEARFRLVDYAWGDPGDRVRTGQTSVAGDQVAAIPDQGSLGWLALGGAGLIAWRGRRTAGQ
jgi:hypothetical protein